jgi:putative ABC transport system ATP-binding protein
VLVTHEDDVAARARQIARFQDGRIVEINKSNWDLNNSASDHSVSAI